MSREERSRWVSHAAKRMGKQACSMQVTKMLKSSFRLVWASLWVALWGSSIALSAERVVEVPAAKVVQLATPDTLEKPPVISGMALNLSRKLLATVGDDHLVYLFDLDYGRPLQRLAGHTDWVKAAAFRPNGDMLATAGADRRICLWDISAKGQPRALPQLTAAVSTLAYSPDGGMLAAAGFDDRVWLFNADSGQPVRELAGPGADIRALAFSTDGSRLAAAGRSGVVRIWEASSGRQIAEFAVSNRRIYTLTYSPDGKLLAAAGQRRIVWLLDGVTGQLVAQLPQRAGEVRSLCFCGDRLLASGGSNNVVHLWDVTTRKRNAASSATRARLPRSCMTPERHAPLRQLRHDRPHVDRGRSARERVDTALMWECESPADVLRAGRLRRRRPRRAVPPAISTGRLMCVFYEKSSNVLQILGRIGRHPRHRSPNRDSAFAASSRWSRGNSSRWRLRRSMWA